MRLQLRPRSQKAPPLLFAWNAVRAGLFSVLLLVFAIMCACGVVDEPRQRIFGAVLRLMMIAWPTTFVARDSFRQLFRAAGLSSVGTREAEFSSESNVNLTHATTSSGERGYAPSECPTTAVSIFNAYPSSTVARSEPRQLDCEMELRPPPAPTYDQNVPIYSPGNFNHTVATRPTNSTPARSRPLEEAGNTSTRELEHMTEPVPISPTPSLPSALDVITGPEILVEGVRCGKHKQPC